MFLKNTVTRLTYYALSVRLGGRPTSTPTPLTPSPNSSVGNPSFLWALDHVKYDQLASFRPLFVFWDGNSISFTLCTIPLGIYLCAHISMAGIDSLVGRPNSVRPITSRDEWLTLFSGCSRSRCVQYFGPHLTHHEGAVILPGFSAAVTLPLPPPPMTARRV